MAKRYLIPMTTHPCHYSLLTSSSLIHAPSIPRHLSSKYNLSDDVEMHINLHSEKYLQSRTGHGIPWYLHIPGGHISANPRIGPYYYIWWMMRGNAGNLKSQLNRRILCSNLNTVHVYRLQKQFSQ